MVWQKTSHKVEWASYTTKYNDREVIVTEGNLKLIGGSLEYRGKRYPLRQTEHMFTEGRHYMSVYTVDAQRGFYKYASFLSGELYLPRDLIDTLQLLDSGKIKQSIADAFSPSLDSLEELAIYLKPKHPRI